MRRCFVCEADTLEPTSRHIRYPDGSRRGFPRVCASCGVLLAAGADAATCWNHLARELAGETFQLAPDAPYGLDLYTLRSAATRLGRGARPLDEADGQALRHPHAERAAAGALFALTALRPRAVSLGIPCRPADLDGVLDALRAQAAWTSDVAILVDGPPRAPDVIDVAGFPQGAVRLAARPLGGDFSAQRNALQDLARHAWMLQLDADEALAPETGRGLPALAALAEGGGAVSIGLPRRNRVEGILSDVYPDVQYRLNRSHVRFTGRVHERPDLGGDWRQGFIALGGAIEHRLTRTHVAARSTRYETMDPGRGRPEEQTALLRPYRP